MRIPPAPPSSGGSFFLPPSGTHLGLILAIIDLGTQIKQFGQNPPKEMRSLRIIFELHGDKCRIDTGAPSTLGKSMGANPAPSSFFKTIIESAMKRVYTDLELAELNLEELLGKNLLVAILHKDKKSRPGEKSAEIKAVMPMIDGVPEIVPYGHPYCFSLNPEEYNEALYNYLPGWLRDEVAKSPEWRALRGLPPLPVTPGPEMVPFPQQGVPQTLGGYVKPTNRVPFPVAQPESVKPELPPLPDPNHPAFATPLEGTPIPSATAAALHSPTARVIPTEDGPSYEEEIPF